MKNFITSNLRRQGRALVPLALGVTALVWLLGVWGGLPTVEARGPAVANPNTTDLTLSSSDAFTIYFPMIFKPLPYVFFDDFSNPNSGWPTAPNNVLDDICSFDYYQGHYRVKVTDYSASGDARCIVPGYPVPKQVNGTFSVRIRRTSDSSRDVLYGFFFGAGTNAYRDRWALEVSPDKDCGDKGFFWLSAIEDGDDKDLIGDVCTDAINIGNEWNELKVIRTSSKIYIYINDRLKGTYNNSYLRDEGYFDLEVVSLYSGTSDSRPTYVEFDDFKVESTTNLP
jgi:hypothetical protein